MEAVMKYMIKYYTASLVAHENGVWDRWYVREGDGEVMLFDTITAALQHIFFDFVPTVYMVKLEIVRQDQQDEVMR